MLAGRVIANTGRHALAVAARASPLVAAPTRARCLATLGEPSARTAVAMRWESPLPQAAAPRRAFTHGRPVYSDSDSDSDGGVDPEAHPYRSLTLDTLNKNLRATEYAVRGAIVIKAQQYERQLAEAAAAGDVAKSGLPFDRIVYCNIGNPQQLGQKPITFVREVLALVNHPALLDHPKVGELFAEDAIDRARRLIAAIPGGVGAYSESKGVHLLRQAVARFIEKRDGHPANADHIFLTDGASPAVQALIRSMLRDKSDCLLIPIPQYPLYSASVALYGGSYEGYYADESAGWHTSTRSIESALQRAGDDGKNVRAIAVINPGNPTGAVMGQDEMRDIVLLASERRLVLLADEVYQENVYAAGREFTSFKKVVYDMGYQDKVQLASFHSVSKGFLGECGHRGGYMELNNFDEAVVDELYKLFSVSLCSNLDGQVLTSVMVDPPQPGMASYELYASERDSILASLKRRAEMLSTAFEAIDGIHCDPVEGALYAFPSISLPDAAVEAAKKAGVAPDFMYTMAMLDETGIVCVPGSGFGQEEGTHHFRVTILPPESEMELFTQRFAAFHTGFIKRYS